MKKLLCLLSIIALTFGCANAPVPEFSKEALTYKLTTLKGDQIKFKDIIKKHKGKTLVIEVWASWCSDCVKNMSNVKELQASYPNADFVFLSCDKTPEAWAKGIERYEIKGDHYLIPDGMKGDFGKAIDLNWIPRYIILDKTGKISLFKAIETDHEQVKTLLTNLKTNEN